MADSKKIEWMNVTEIAIGVLIAGIILLLLQEFVIDWLKGLIG